MDEPETTRQLLDRLHQWRIKAARGTGKARVSLRDLATATGVPHNSLSNYLSGATRMPADVLDAVVLALGATGEEARAWAAAWENAAAAESGADKASPQVPTRVPRQLPADVSAFTGREDFLKTLDEFATGSHGPAIVITAVAGAPGVGKTSLAVHWAHQVADQFDDGQLYVNLRGYDPAEPLAAGAVLEMFLNALGADAVPAGLDERAARYRSLLSDKRMLIVLDNARSADQIRPLIPGTPGCLVLVTSRDALTGLVVRDGARRVDLARLSDTESVDLLTRILGAERVATDPEAAADLARLCAGLPLALRIAAEHIAGHSDVPLAELAAELADGTERWEVLDATGDPFSDVRAVFSWSYRTLAAPAARLFRLLGLNPAPESSAFAAANLAGLPLGETRRLLRTLTAAHLLERSADGRYTWHDLLRSYAADLVDREETPDERRKALLRLLDWYRHTLDTAMDGLKIHRRRLPDPFPEPAVPGPTAFDDPADAREWLTAECGNIAVLVRFALHEGQHQHAWQLARTIWRFCYIAGRGDDWFDIVRDGLAAAESLDDAFGQAELRNALGTAYAVSGRYDQAVAEFSAGLPLAAAAGDRTGEAVLLCNLGNAHRVMRAFEPASAALRRALELNRELGDRGNEAISQANLAMTAGDLGRFREAVDHTVAVLPLLREVGHQHGEILALGNLAHFHQRLGEHEDALRAARRAIGLAETLGDRRILAEAVNDLAQALVDTPEAWPEAEPVARRALALTRDLADPDGEGLAHHILGLVAFKAGHPAASIDAQHMALALWSEIGMARRETIAHNALGAGYLALGDLYTAATHYNAALHLSESGADRYEQARAQQGIAAVLLAEEDAAGARRSLERALRIFAELEVPEASAVREMLTALPTDR